MSNAGPTTGFCSPPAPFPPGWTLQCPRSLLCLLPLPQTLQLPRLLPALGACPPLTQRCQLLRALRGGGFSTAGWGPGVGPAPPTPTWSRNMRETISRTCRAHCCSAGVLARNLSRSSMPLMCRAHSTRSCTLASPSTPWGATQGGGSMWGTFLWGSLGPYPPPLPLPAQQRGQGARAARCAPAAGSARSAARPPPASAPSPAVHGCQNSHRPPQTPAP